MPAENATYFVLENEGEILGGAGIGFLPGADSGVCELQKMYFSASARGKGWGDLMMNKLSERGQKIWISTGVYRDHALYESSPKALCSARVSLYRSPLGKYRSLFLSGVSSEITLVVLLTEIEKLFKEELSQSMEDTELRSVFQWLLDEYCDLPAFALIFRPETTVDHETETLFFKALTRLKTGEPIQYITGKAPFLGTEYRVNPSVLIPRPETEELVLWAKEHLGQYGESLSGEAVLDVGTGSGCIATQLARFFPKMKVRAVDHSLEALEIARLNARQMGVEVDFRQEDALSADWMHTQKYQLIISNPPYVMESEKEGIHSRVKAFEPGLALFVPDEDPLRFYKAIARFAAVHLKQGGALYFEINALFEREIEQLLEELGFVDLESRQDFRGNPRMIRAQIP